MQSFLVAGISRSGIAAAEYLLENGAKEVLLYDDVSDEGVRAATERLTARGCRALSKEEAFSACTECDVLVLSPGIPVDPPAARRLSQGGKGDHRRSGARGKGIALSRDRRHGDERQDDDGLHDRAHSLAGGQTRRRVREYRASAHVLPFRTRDGGDRRSGDLLLSARDAHVLAPAYRRRAEHHGRPPEPPLYDGQLHLSEIAASQKLYGERICRSQRR